MATHPELYATDVLCACGHHFSTKIAIDVDRLKVDICSKCHPYFTGESTIIDTEGTVQAFMRRYEKSSDHTG